MLATLGGLAGVAIAAVALPALVSLSPDWFVRIETVQLDWAVLAFTAGATMVTAVAFGLLPALESSRGDVVRGLRSGGTRSTGSRTRTWYLNGLVAAQVAFAFVLLVSAGLLVRSLVGMTRADLGADPEGVLSLQVRLPLGEYTSEVQVPSGLPTRDYSPRIPLFYEQSLGALRNVSGVVSAGGVSLPPFTFAGQDLVVAVDREPAPESDLVRVGQYWVTDGSFETMRVPVVAGRTITAADSANAPWVVVISESLARRLWPEGGAVGRFVRVSPHPSYAEPPREVVGVVADTRVQLTDPSPVPLIYVPHRQQLARHGSGQAPWRTRMTFLLRTRGEPTALAPAARQAVAGVDAGQPVFDVRPVVGYVDDQTLSTRYFMSLLAGFAGVALVLGLVGIYGVTAHSVSLRTREFGIRRALGAQVGHVLRLAVGRSAAIVGVGLMVGLGAAAGATRFLESLLWNVGATDSGTFVGTALLLMLAGLVACIVPAWRATRVAPADVLRSE
jgi:putative ABC transport system permease protein